MPPINQIQPFESVAACLLNFSSELLQQQLWLFDIIEDWFRFINIILVVDAEQFEPFSFVK